MTVQKSRLIVFLLLFFTLVLLMRRHNAEKIVSFIEMVDEQASPLDSLPIQKMDIIMTDRVLKANFLSLGEDAPAVFICTGNGETLFDWLPVQQYLREQGLSSYVFSYSGFGNSSGKPSETSLYEDALAAYEQFVSHTPQSSQRIALSHSLGCVPIHGIARQLQPAPDKLIIHAPFYSIQQLLVELEVCSNATKWLWPDIFNNLPYARDISIPTLYMHSRKDTTVSHRHSEILSAAMGPSARLLLMDQYGHNAIYKDVGDAFYRPILEFISN